MRAACKHMARHKKVAPTGDAVSVKMHTKRVPRQTHHRLQGQQQGGSAASPQHQPMRRSLLLYNMYVYLARDGTREPARWMMSSLAKLQGAEGQDE